VNLMKTTMFLVSWVLIGSMIWGGTLAEASPQEAGVSASQAGEVMTLKIEGWTCASCEKDIRRALLAVPGVNSADVSYARGGAVVAIELGRVSKEQLTQAVASAGNILSTYRASVVPNGSLTVGAVENDGVGSRFRNLFK
jgi:copper chaperone CopZ